MAIYRKFTVWGKRINIEKGEEYCPECKGRGMKFGTISVGKYGVSAYKHTIKTPCGFCQGYGKTDWIQKATNEPKVAPPPGMNIKYITENLQEYSALWIARQIDKEIIDSLITFGMIKRRIFFESLKLYAKNAGVPVVTASQIHLRSSSDAVKSVEAKVILIGLIEQQDLVKTTKNTPSILHMRVMKSRQP